jgi:hypothetical protein
MRSTAYGGGAKNCLIQRRKEPMKDAKKNLTQRRKDAKAQRKKYKNSVSVNRPFIQQLLNYRGTLGPPALIQIRCICGGLAIEFSIS